MKTYRCQKSVASKCGRKAKKKKRRGVETTEPKQNELRILPFFACCKGVCCAVGVVNEGSKKKSSVGLSSPNTHLRRGFNAGQRKALLCEATFLEPTTVLLPQQYEKKEHNKGIKANILKSKSAVSIM